MTPISWYPRVLYVTYAPAGITRTAVAAHHNTLLRNVRLFAPEAEVGQQAIITPAVEFGSVVGSCCQITAKNRCWCGAQASQRAFANQFPLDLGRCRPPRHPAPQCAAVCARFGYN